LAASADQIPDTRYSQSFNEAASGARSLLAYSDAKADEVARLV